MPFSTKDIPDLSGKVFIVTGGNTGIGRITCLELARKKAHVILACRSEERTLPVIESIKKETGNDKVEFMKCDLSSLKSVDEFANAFINRKLPLHCLINNAGVMACPFTLTEDGLESQFATNHLGHFLLTKELLPILEQNTPSRIVFLSSMAHKWTYPAGIEFDKINDQSIYKPWPAYGQSKLSNILCARGFANLLKDKQVYVNAVHPGYVRTDLSRHLGEVYGVFLGVLSKISEFFFALSPEKGALTSLYVATSPDIETKNYRGEYFTPIAKLSKTSELGNSSQLIEKLWDFSEKLLQEKLPSKNNPSSQQERQEQQDLSEN
jgi:retinol dehydrogenase-12